MNSNEIESKVSQFLATELEMSVEKITACTTFVKDEMIDSLALLKLISFLNKSFNIELNISDLEENDFQSVANIAKLVSHSVESSKN